MTKLYLNTLTITRLALRRLTLTLCTGVIAAATALAQPTIEPRTVISYGPTGVEVAEVDVAAYRAAETTSIPPAKLVAMWVVDFANMPMQYAVSLTGGQTWSSPLEVPRGAPGSSAQIDPTIAVGPYGTFVGVYVSNAGTTNSAFHATVMRPGCNLFGDTDCNGMIADATVIGSMSGLDFPKVVAGPGATGTTYYVTGSLALSPNIVFSTSTNSGASWSTLGVISAGDPATTVVGKLAWPAASPDGTLHIAYIHPEGQGSDTTFFYRLLRSTDFGAAFTRVDDQPQHLNLEFHPSSHVGPLFNAYVPGQFRISPFGNLVAHPSKSNRLYLVYNDRNGEPTQDPVDADMDVFIVRSTDGGETWSAPFRVNKDIPPIQNPEYVDQWMPRMTVDESDRVHVIWYDTRSDAHAADFADPFEIECYYAWADDNGGALSFAEQSLGGAIRTQDLINTDFIGDYNGLTQAGNLVVPVYMATGGSAGLAPRFADEEIVCNRISR